MAPAASTDAKAWITPSTRSMRSRQACVSSTGETSLRSIAGATSASDRQGQSAGGDVDIRLRPGLDAELEDRLDVVGQVQVPKLLDVLHHPVEHGGQDRKSTRLNSSHLGISY